VTSEDELEIVIPYTPRGAFKEFHGTDKRWRVAVCHRRAGKTVACINELIFGAMTCDKIRPRFAYIAPLLKQAKTVAWDYLKYYGLAIPGAVPHESELRVDFPNGGQVRLYGGDNPDGLRGIYLDGVILDEAADMSPRVFSEIIRPALSDRKGWAVYIGTPKGQNDFFDLWQYAKKDDAYFTMMLRASESGLIDKVELDDARRSMTPEQYAQEYECSFQAAILGAYYGHEMDDAEERRIVPNLYDPSLKVNTAWDLGVNDQTAIWFYQQQGFEIRLVDYYASAGYGLDHYAKVLQDRGYLYGTHYLPHDVEVKELGTGRSRLETLRGLGLSSTVVVRKLGIADGINAVRKLLPRCWFDRDKCAEGIKAMRQYRREYDDLRKVFLERPLHDWASDPADAFRYLAVGLQEPTAAAKALPKRSMSWVA
jgi:phage terminase large subunit